MEVEFKHEDLWVAMLLFETGDYLFPFDLDTTVYLGLGKGGGRGGALCAYCATI